MVIVAQKNKIRHLINFVQIKKFARANNQDIIILYPSIIKSKNYINLIQYALLFEA